MRFPQYSWLLFVCGGLLLEGAARAAGTPPPGSIPIAGRDCMAADCHASLRDQQFVHPPVIEGLCSPCHVPLRDGDAATTGVHPLQTREPVLALCSQCHQDPSFTQKEVHAPFTQRCTVCHDPHGGKIRYFLKAGTPGKLCLGCHAKVLEGKSLLHPPADQGECLKCHVPHTSEYKGVFARPPERLCGFCHVDLYLEIHKAVSVHPPARDACFKCHDPHGANRAMYLLAEGDALCISCHPSMSKERRDQFAYPHNRMTEQSACIGCHMPHDSAYPRLVNQSPLAVCGSCHNQEITTAKGRKLPAVTKQIEESNYRHGPVKKDDCVPCHAVHGNNDPRLLKGSYPEGVYVKFQQSVYGLCFQCHDEALITETATIATGFRNGTRNLHSVHVLGDQGRSCGVCHDVHASPNPFEIRTSFTFGEEQLKILYRKTPNGGMCETECHRPRGYDRVKAVDNSPPVTGPAP